MKFLLLFCCLFSFFSKAKRVFPQATFPIESTLHEAVYYGDIRKVKALLKKRVDVNNKIGERAIEERSIRFFYHVK
ncbi:MAG: ankyrin repeat domain-containing protein [Oligoflexia bacterium]|nr:ankyrin repeat domain-containing protein [Oligoflexia bacterium]